MTQNVWLINGTSTGFGREVVQLALQRGDKVIATARKISAIEDLKAAGASVLALDVSADQSTLDKIAKQAHDIYGRIDILVNMAGYMMEGAVEETSSEELFKIFDVNVFGAIRVCNAVLPFMRAAKKGVVANVGSIGSWQGVAAAGPYCASKGAISLLTEAMKGELEPLGISVTVVEPGYFRTALLTGGNKQVVKKSIPDYEVSCGPVKKLLKEYNLHQPGDPVKGSQVIIDVLTKTGAWQGRDIPVRVLLGSDAYAMVKGRCEGTVQLMDGMKDVITSTDHDDTK